MPDLPLETPALNLSSDERLHQTVRKLAHDLRSPLSVMAMGIEAIRIMKNDPDQCDALCEMMSREGVESMKRILEEMIEKSQPNCDSQ